MKMLPRTEFGNPILRRKAKNVPLKTIRTPAFKKLVQQMLYTMRRAQGVGLAAPQINKPLQLAVMEMHPTKTRPRLPHKGPIVVVNPKLVGVSKNKKRDWEGCLSFRNVRGHVPRSTTITVQYLNEKWESIREQATGFWARIFQHEIDHLNGIVYVDRMDDMRTLMTKKEFVKRILKKKK
jgi:peptide deformylase